MSPWRCPDGRTSAASSPCAARRRSLESCLLVALLSGCGSAAPAGGEHTGGGERPSETPDLPGRPPTRAERAAIAPLEEMAERVRSLQFRAEVPVRIQTAEEIARFVGDSIEQDELERARRFYLALGMLPPDLDVEAMLVSVMGEQVVGYYDPDADVMVIRDDVMAELERAGRHSIERAESASVLVHEYVHALQDQNLGLSEAMALDRSIDEENAFGSVVEGDATLAMIGYMTDMAHVPLRTFTADPARVRALLEGGMSAPRGDALGAAPAIVRVPLLSHYFDGLLLCAAVHGQRDWAGVDALHAERPTTTEQVLHPDRFFAREPAELVTLPELPGVLAAGYAVLDEDTLGELELSIFLGRGDTDRDRSAGEGWGGDRVRVYQRGELLAAVWFTSWDTEPDATEAETAMLRLPRAGERIRRVGRAVLYQVGLPDTVTAELDTAFDAWAATLGASEASRLEASEG